MATWVIEGSGAGRTEPRRRVSDNGKARMVSEAMMPGASVLDVAPRLIGSANLWCIAGGALLRDWVAVEAPLLSAPAFVPVEVASAPASMLPELLEPGVVEVVGSGDRSYVTQYSTLRSPCALPKTRRLFMIGF